MDIENIKNQLEAIKYHVITDDDGITVGIFIEEDASGVKMIDSFCQVAVTGDKAVIDYREGQLHKEKVVSSLDEVIAFIVKIFPLSGD